MLKQSEWECLNSIVEKIYSIYDLTAMREYFLRHLNFVVPFDFSDFELGSARKHPAPDLVDAVVVSKYPKDFEESFISLYESRYSQMDYVKWIFSSSESLVYRESDLINEEARKKSLFYKEYLKPFGLVHVSGISLIDNGAFLGSVTLYRTEEKGDFTDSDIYVLNQLLPHLQSRLSRWEDKTRDPLKNVSYLLRTRYSLTPREIEIIGLAFMGYSNEKIGSLLYIAENTVKKHMSNIFVKLNVSSRALLIRFLIENKLDDVFSP